MSEKIYALFFRLFPARFRAAWQEDAVELIRERSRNERGVVSRLRLWSDLAADLVFSLPRVYLRETTSLAPEPRPHSAGVPTFRPLETPPVRSSAYFFATILSALIIVLVSILLKQGGHFPIPRPGAAEETGGATVDPWATGSGGDGNGSTIALGNGSDPSAAHSAGSVGPTSVVHVGKANYLFDYAQRQLVLNGVGQNLRDHYPDPDVARSAVRSLRFQNGLGRLNAATDPAAFAALVTTKLRESTHDLHVEVVYSERPLPASPTGPSPEMEAQYRAAQLSANCTFQPVEILPHNVGYLKLNSFPDPGICSNAAAKAMAALDHADAVILDLRDNSGGSPQMVMFLGAYFFDHPAFFYNPRENDAARMWTHSPVPGSRLSGKPLFVLTSSRTYSAAEHFSYDLKMLHRATLIGETTAGATDVGVFHRIDDHFGIAMRESKVPNPYASPDWAVHGVQPDIQVPASAALFSAEKLATDKLANP